jgi:dihydroorotate dehydrogenase electron transfer subunit
MPAPPPDARSRLARVTAKRPCGVDGYVIEVELKEDLPEVRASRFFMLRREERDGSSVSPLIPRPYSIYHQRGRRLEFLVQRIGRGSRALVEAPLGATLRLVGPLGNGWPALEGGGAPWVMLAGGVGSAPFLLAILQALAGFQGARPCRAEELWFLFGARSSDRLYDAERFRDLGVQVEFATQDGTRGFHGNTLELLAHLQAEGRLPERVRILACGPEPMLEAVERHAMAHGLEAWLSLESYMGCGVGICNGCPVPTREGGALGAWPNAKCCVEGPVFPVGDITLLAQEA